MKEPTHGYQNCNTSQILIFGGYVKLREISVYLSFYLGQLIPFHTDTRTI